MLCQLIDSLHISWPIQLGICARQPLTTLSAFMPYALLERAVTHVVYVIYFEYQ